jgi:hypothetical protein
MTEEQIKEALSRGFVRLVANRRGFKCKFDETDHGVDITLSEVAPRARPDGGTRLTETGRYVDLQIKCTTDASVTLVETGFKFDLESKSYNDLVARLDDPGAAPLALVLFVLPNDEDAWLTVGEDELLLRRGAYWWRPAPGSAPTDNTASKRIEIPFSQRATLDFAPTLYAEFFQ